MRLPPSVSSRNDAWPSQVSVAMSPHSFRVGGPAEHRRTVRAEGEATSAVGRRVLPFVLALLAALADARGSHGLAFDALLAAVPFAAVAALVAFGDWLEQRGDALGGVQALLWTLVLALLVLSCAARSPASAANTLPPLGRSALEACLAVFALKASVGLVPLFRRGSLPRPAKP